MKLDSRFAGALLFMLCLAQRSSHANEPDRRAIDVPRFGVAVQAPLGWELVDREHDDKAFVLKLPEEQGTPSGFVACELGVAPEDLEEFQRRHQANDEAEQRKPSPRRKLTENAIQPLDAKLYGEEAAANLGERLTSVWKSTGEDGVVGYEVRARLISEGTLYTFILSTDEAHYEAYRIDFDELLASARFSPPETGLQRLPNGYWMQRDFRFALKLPPDWKPAFAPNDRALFFATGATHEVFSDNLLVLASEARALDLAALAEKLPDEIKRQDSEAEVPLCSLVPQGNGQALETVIQTQRGPFEITILTRRFAGEQRNYEVIFTCETSEFEKTQAELRAALDSFRDLKEATGKGLL